MIQKLKSQNQTMTRNTMILKKISKRLEMNEMKNMMYFKERNQSQQELMSLEKS